MQIFTYNDFLKDKGIITFEQAEKIYEDLMIFLSVTQDIPLFSTLNLGTLKKSPQDIFTN